ncbi:unnamed protein product [Schistosoma mattheei]|uniref:Uncharacterized protein n=1 Tax=Schistosoma mattheei TaxID=31246 RepID=A0A183PWE9_9TREM|nr:unnamed protein product [Schistosoma mattheei]
MALLQHDDPNVRYNALVSLQKIMVHNCPVNDTTSPKRNGGNTRNNSSINYNQRS